MMDYDKYLYPHRLIFDDPDQSAERIAQIRATGITNIGLIGNIGGLVRQNPRLTRSFCEICDAEICLRT